jgi:hypothetical protein
MCMVYYCGPGHDCTYVLNEWEVAIGCFEILVVLKVPPIWLRKVRIGCYLAPENGTALLVSYLSITSLYLDVQPVIHKLRF